MERPLTLTGAIMMILMNISGKVLKHLVGKYDLKPQNIL